MLEDLSISQFLYKSDVICNHVTSYFESSVYQVSSFKSFLPCPFGVVDHSAHSEESSVLDGQMPSSPLVLD